jgi:eukaryotic-like serine/threonine-protein kinase
MKKGTVIKLSKDWILGDEIGHGGFAPVYAASSGDQRAVVKLVTKAPGADRELLFADLGKNRNLIPIIDRGEHGAYWVLVMPRAEMNLRQHLLSSGGRLTLDDSASVLKDVCDALADLDGKVVHRDIKPENVLRLAGHWCIADFGISRYAEASTAPDTRKFALTPQYASPEQWKAERSTSAADVYALGVMAFEMVAGERPFPGPTREDYREQHLHLAPPSLTGVPAGLASLVDECLYKAPGARPSAANIRARLEHVVSPPVSPGLARLQQANRDEVRRLTEESSRRTQAESEAQRRASLGVAAKASLSQISTQLLDGISRVASSAVRSADRDDGWSLRLNKARLALSPVRPNSTGNWGQHSKPAFDVVCYSSLNLVIPQTFHGYEGRSHSLWFGDIQREGEYGWYESAFMFGFLARRIGAQAPFFLDPSAEAMAAIGPGIGAYAVAWPFTPLVAGSLDEFIDRWAGWLADGADGRLNYPGHMPERDPQGSWRRQ